MAMFLLMGVFHAVSIADDLGAELEPSFVWVQEPVTNKELHAGFRRVFSVNAAPISARLHLFAYTRYRLYVNGEYVGRGPNRFESIQPEYDSWDIAARLHSGTNVIAVVVHRDWPGDAVGNMRQTLSRFRRHAPDFIARLELADVSGPVPPIGTEFGPASVSWKKSGGGQNFKITVPENCAAILALPTHAGSQLELDGKIVIAEKRGARQVVVLHGGRHSGKI